MPSSDKWEKWTMGCGICGAIVLFLVGLHLTIVGIVAYTKDEFETVNNMIMADTNAEEVWKPTPHMFMLVFIIFGIVIMVASLCGCLGSATEVEGLVCTYFFFTMIGGLCLLMVAVINMGFSRTLEGVVERQATTYCDQQLYPIFKEQLACNSTAYLENTRRLTLACDEECDERVELLQKMRGCVTLWKMCHSFGYKSMGVGYCSSGDTPITSAWVGQAKSGSFDALSCQRICNEHVGCSGTTYNSLYDGSSLHPPLGLDSACFIISKEAPTSTEAREWVASGRQISAEAEITGADGTEGVECFVKGGPEFLKWGKWFSRWVSVFCVISSLAIFIITCSSCTFLFTLTTRRKGKKGACAVCWRMLCPCCIPRYERKFDNYEMYEEEESSEEDEYEE